MRNQVEVMSPADIEKAKQTVEQSVNYFYSKFRKVRSDLHKKGKAYEDMKDAEIEFAYLIDEIERGPWYNIPKAINDCEDFIKAVESEEVAH